VRLKPHSKEQETGNDIRVGGNDVGMKKSNHRQYADLKSHRNRVHPSNILLEIASISRLEKKAPKKEGSNKQQVHDYKAKVLLRHLVGKEGNVPCHIRGQPVYSKQPANIHHACHKRQQGCQLRVMRQCTAFARCRNLVDSDKITGGHACFLHHLSAAASLS
jgi:hypothetical protein